MRVALWRDGVLVEVTRNFAESPASLILWDNGLSPCKGRRFGAGGQNIDPSYISVCGETRIEVWTSTLVTGTVRGIIEERRDNHTTVPKLYPCI